MRRLTRLFKLKPQPTQVDVLTGYAHWAKSYPAHAHNPLMELEEQAMLNLLPPDLSGQVCLDLACGSGRYMRLMQNRQGKQVFGVDYSADMLAQAINSPFAIRHSLLARSTFLSLPFASATFDLITCGLAVGHEKNLGQTLAEMSRVLRQEGTVIYSDFHPFGALSGWQRSFTAANGATYHLEHYLHLYSDHHRACQSAGLTITAVLEPVGGERVPADFQHLPLVLVIRAEKIEHSPEN